MARQTEPTRVVDVYAAADGCVGDAWAGDEIFYTWHDAARRSWAGFGGVRRGMVRQRSAGQGKWSSERTCTARKFYARLGAASRGLGAVGRVRALRRETRVGPPDFRWQVFATARVRAGRVKTRLGAARHDRAWLSRASQDKAQFLGSPENAGDRFSTGVSRHVSPGRGVARRSRARQRNVSNKTR
jgi:hypothetical protein